VLMLFFTTAAVDVSYVLTCLVVFTDIDEWVDAGVTLSTAGEQHPLKLEVS